MYSPFKVHSLATLFPSMTEAEFATLRDDVAAHGLREPVWTWQGFLIDGRHRARACEELDIECPSREYQGDDPLAFVLSLNLNRRHLNESQRAMVAASIANMKPGRPGETASIEAVSQSAAAEKLNVSRSAVQRASKVMDEGAPELVEAVKSGAVKVSAAAQVTDLPPEKQADLVKRGEVKAKARAKPAEKPVEAPDDAAKDERIADLEAALQEVSGHAQELLAENEQHVARLSTNDETKALIEENGRLRGQLKDLQSRINGLVAERDDLTRLVKSYRRKLEAVEGAGK